jgi:hypothetical protein
MAKELPYFKFEPNQWENGNIQICSREEKGLFIDLCSMYWSRLGDVPYKLALQKLCNGNATALQSLCDEQIIEVIDDNIFIKFLSEQLSEFEDVSSQNSRNAKIRWEKHRKQKEESERNATASNPQCETDAIREEKSKEEKIKENKRDSAIDFLNSKAQVQFTDFEMQNKGLINDWDGMLESFNDKIEIEVAQNKIQFHVGQLMPRLRQYARSWKSNQKEVIKKSRYAGMETMDENGKPRLTF